MSWLGRRLPRKSGDAFVQAADAISLAIVLALIFCARVPLRRTYQAGADAFHIWVPMLSVGLLAMLLPIEISGTWLQDALWSAGLYLDTVAILPQLALIAQNGGVVD